MSTKHDFSIIVCSYFVIDLNTDFIVIQYIFHRKNTSIVLVFFSNNYQISDTLKLNKLKYLKQLFLNASKNNTMKPFYYKKKRSRKSNDNSK